MGGGGVRIRRKQDVRLLHDKIGSELALCQYCSFIVKCGNVYISNIIFQSFFSGGTCIIESVRKCDFTTICSQK